MKDLTIINQELLAENAILKQQIQSLEKSVSALKQVEEELRISEERFDLAMQAAQEGIWDWNMETNAVFYSPKWKQMLGYTEEEIEPHARAWNRLLHPDDRERAYQLVDTVLRGEGEYEIEFRLRHKNGQYLDILSRGFPVRRQPGAPVVRIVGTHSDLTERKRSEEKLIYIMKAVESTRDAIGISDAQGHHIYQNKALSDLFGYATATELEAAGGGPAVVKDPAVAQEMFANIMQGKSWSGELEMVTKSGRVFPAFERADAIKDNEGNLIGLIGIITDITELKQVAAALQESEREAKHLARENELIAEIGRLISSTLNIEEVYEHFAAKVREAIPIDRIVVNTINRQDYTRTTRYVNGYLAPGRYPGEVLPIVGTRTEHVLLTKSSLVFSGKSGKDREAQFPGMLARSDSQAIMMVPLISKDEVIGVLAFHSNKVAAYSHDDLLLAERVGSQIAGAIANAQLFLERTQAEAALKIFKESVENSSDAIGLSTPAGCHYYQNKAFDQLFGTIGEIPAQIVYADREIGEEVFQTLMSGGQWTGEVKMYAQDRRIRDILLHGYPVKDEQGNITALVGIHTDITERKRAEENIRRSEEFVRTILDTVDEGFIVVDGDYRILTANKAYCHQHTGNCDDVIGRHCYEISHKVSRPCSEEGEECAVQTVFATGRPHTALHKHPGQDGQVIYVDTKAFPIQDESGKVISVIETINNITEKHLLAEEQLKTQKLESIGTLAGGIAHDFNNLLQGVFGYITMAKMTFDQREKSLAMLEQAEKALHQSVNLTTQLLTFSKGGKPVKKVISLPPVIENAVKFALSGSRTNFQLEIDPALWHVNGDEGQLGQVIQNIVLNADQAMPLGGVVKISARNAATGDAALPYSLVKGNYVELVIKDNGVGIPQQYFDKIFDPYFTTKEKGSGLGLATSYSIIRNHDGQIRVASECGQGTVLSLYIPAVTEIIKSAEAGDTAPAAATKGRVLVMDDEELIRDLAMELLQMLGNEAAVAANGEEALTKYREAAAAGRPFDIVILDLTIRGGMGGLETVQKLLEIDPGVQAVVSSGYSEDAAVANYRDYGFQAFLKKPYKMQELRNVLLALLAK